MAIPFSYSMRNLWKRRLTTMLTVPGWRSSSSSSPPS